MPVAAYDFNTSDNHGIYSMSLYFSGCNLSCDFCYNKQLLYTKRKVDFLDIQNKFHEQMKIVNGRLGLVYSGGEPTVASDFYDYYNYFSQYNIRTMLHTNGIVFHKNSVFDSVIVSLKSSKEVDNFDLYIQKMKEPLNHYDSSCENKELRIVLRDNRDYNREYSYALDKLDNVLKNYKIVKVKEVSFDG